MEKSKKKSNGYKFLKLRIILFLILCGIVCATLPFSAWFEDKYNEYLTKDYGEYATAIEKDLVVHVIDVGNADCIAIELPDGKKGLIDAGVSTGSLGSEYRNKAINYIKNNIFDGNENGIFDFFILTHQDADHCNNLVNIFSNFQFKVVYRPAMFYYKPGADTKLINDELGRAKVAGFVSDSTTSFASLSGWKFSTSSIYANALKAIYSEKYVEEGVEKDCQVKYNYTGTSNFTSPIVNSNVISGDGYEMKYYSPNYLNYTENNDYSPVMVLSYRNKSICLTGDAEEGVERYLTNNANLPKVDVLKVGHHGGDTSSKAYFLDVLKPTYAFISCNNSDNKYGHPNAAVIKRLEDCGVATNNILNTKENGTLIYAVDNAGEMFIATSDGFIFVRIKWIYVCGTVLIVGASIIFGIGAKSKKRKLKTQVAGVNLSVDLPNVTYSKKITKSKSDATLKTKSKTNSQKQRKNY